MCKTLCHGIGRTAAAACATWPAPCKVTKNYDTRRAAAGRSGSKRCRGVSKLTKIVTIRQKKYLAPTAVWPTAAAVWQLKNRRGAAKSGLARPTPRALFLTPSSCGGAKGHAPAARPRQPPAGRHATRRRQKSARRGPTKAKKRAAALPVRRFYVYLQCSNPRATAAPGPPRAARVLQANH